MGDEIIDDFLATLKLIVDWLVTSKMIKKLFTPLYTDENIFYFNEDSGHDILNCNGFGILNIDLNDIKLDNYFDEDDTIILIRLLVLHIKFEKMPSTLINISEELMTIVWHPKIWWNFCMSGDEKKEI